MQTPKGRALMQAVRNARGAYLEAEKDYRTAMNIAFDTEFQSPDGTFGLHSAARKSVNALQTYRKATEELRDYLGRN
jgi:hypothetical protein